VEWPPTGFNKLKKGGKRWAKKKIRKKKGYFKKKKALTENPFFNKANFEEGKLLEPKWVQALKSLIYIKKEDKFWNGKFGVPPKTI